MARWLVLLVLLLAGCNLSQQPATPQALPTLDTRLSCEQIVNVAVETAGSACNTLGRNQVCYGHRLVQVEFQEAAGAAFGAPGDIADLLAVRQISASAFDSTQVAWGIALVKAQANIPDTLPGQNVTFLLFGETALDALAPRLTAVRLETRPGPTSCVEAPSAMLVQTPAGTQVTLTLNGATLTLGSTLYLTAARSDQLIVATIEGSAVVSAFNTTRVVLPGALVRLPLGGASELEVTGPPSEPEPFDAEAIRRAPLSLLDAPVTIPPPISATSPSRLLATETLGVPFSPQLPTAAPCLPRADWTATYTIQRGDTLFSIARLFNIPVAELQQANCIANPNLIQAGQVLRVPFALGQPTLPPTFTPFPTLTLTPFPTFTPAPTHTPLPFDNDNRDDDKPIVTDEPIR